MGKYGKRKKQSIPAEKRKKNITNISETSIEDEIKQESLPLANEKTDSTFIKKKKDWRKMLMNRKWDYGLAALLFIINCITMFTIHRLSILSVSLLIKVISLCVAVNLLLFVLIFIRKLPQALIWIRRILILCICVALTYTSILVTTMQTSLEAITQPETATTVNVSLITKQEGGARVLENLSDKKIGIQNANDYKNSNYVKEQLEKETSLKNVTYVEDIDYSSLYKKLVNGEIDALIITDYYFNTLLTETFPTIQDDIFILKSYQKQKEQDISTSTKDIRYQPFTIYLAGIDEGDDPSIDARSDVNIVLAVNPIANHIEMVSIPRDSYVPNPALYNRNDKLTHLGLNGVENTMQGLESVLGFEIDFYVKLNFFSVIDIIDAIGKIEVEVPVSFCEQDENRSFEEEDLICLNEGVQTLNGKQALAFARHRKSYTDVLRGKAQQEIIKGIISSLTTASAPVKINNVMKVAPKSVSTNMPMGQVTNFISAELDNLKPWTINSILLENGVDASLITASMPGQELSVMLLNQLDIQNVFDAYQTMIDQMQFNTFSFHLDKLAEEKETLPYNNQMLWAGMNTSSYSQGNASVPSSKPETKPSNNQPSTQTPSASENPNTEETPLPENPVTPTPNEKPQDPEPENPEQEPPKDTITPPVTPPTNDESNTVPPQS